MDTEQQTKRGRGVARGEGSSGAPLRGKGGAEHAGEEGGGEEWGSGEGESAGLERVVRREDGVPYGSRTGGRGGGGSGGSMNESWLHQAYRR